MVVDVLGDHVVVASSAAWVELHRPLVEAALLRALGPCPSRVGGAAPVGEGFSVAGSGSGDPHAGHGASAPSADLDSMNKFLQARQDSAGPPGHADASPMGLESGHAASSHGGAPEASGSGAAPAEARDSAGTCAAAGFGGAGQWRLIWRPSVEMLREEGLDMRRQSAGPEATAPVTAEAPAGEEGALTGTSHNAADGEHGAAADEVTATKASGEQDQPISVLEAGIHYAVQPAHGQKTGFYAGEVPQCADKWNGCLWLCGAAACMGSGTIKRKRCGRASLWRRHLLASGARPKGSCRHLAAWVPSQSLAPSLPSTWAGADQ